jgi:putative drug exporter of the RND superfamily
MIDTQKPMTQARREPRGPVARLAGAYRWRGAKWLVLAVWFAAVAIASPLAAQLPDVEQNDTVEFLPESAESLRVYELREQFPGDDTLPAVVVYHREGGLSASDRAQAEADHRELAGRFPDLQLSPIVPSEDGNALMYVVPLSDEGDAWYDQTAEIRDLVTRSGSLEVKVTGPAGFTRDFVDVFDGIDSTLLIASASVVTVLLLLIYRSPFLWIVPLLVVGFAHQTSSALIYGFVTQLGLTANSQNTGLLPVLVFGVGTDYALLLIARYREELRRFEDKHEAMVNALRRAGPAIIASGGTTIVGLLCLLAADLNSTRGLGPIGAAGIFSAFVAMITLLPAVLLIFGRRIFWPFVPEYGSASGAPNGIWSRIGRFVSGRPRAIWVSTAVLLGVLALGFVGTDTHLAHEDAFRTEPESIAGQRLLAASFPAGSGAPTIVLARAEAADRVEAAIDETQGVVDVRLDGESGDLVAFAVTLDADPSSQAAFDIIDDLRDRVHAIPGAEALVGGQDAMDLDVARANASDRLTVIPLVLGLVLLILVLLLRAFVAPLLMTLTSILSFFSALGASVLVFEHVFGFPALESQVVLLSFVFLVTLGVDYNIFLMSRVREEASRVGTREGTLRGLAVTGGVITSAGLVLAATFSVVMVLPLVFMTQLGFIIALGILLETMIVRSIVLPALSLDLDRWIWWPGKA